MIQFLYFFFLLDRLLIKLWFLNSRFLFSSQRGFDEKRHSSLSDRTLLWYVYYRLFKNLSQDLCFDPVRGNKTQMMCALETELRGISYQAIYSKVWLGSTSETLTSNFRNQEGLASWTMGNKSNLSRVKGIKVGQPESYPCSYGRHKFQSQRSAVKLWCLYAFVQESDFTA